MPRPWRAVAGIAAALAVTAFAGYVALELLQQDLAAYWVAGSVRRLGLDPYVNHAVEGFAPWDGSVFHHSRFLYPPLAAELFRPLALLPYRAAKILFSAVLIASWIATAVIARREARGWTGILIGGALFFPLFLNFERGQIDLLLMLLLVVAWKVRHRAVAAGGLFALAAAFKPALLGILPVVAALGRWRWLAAALGWCAVAAGVTLAVSGPTLLREYGATVLPRALLYGEGGTIEMAYSESALMRVSNDDHGATQRLDGRSYYFTLDAFDRPVSASLPRLLAPESPSWPTSLLPYPLAAALLAWAARRVVRAGPRSDAGEHLLLVAALLACVVTSPAGWAMGFVWALPIAPIAWSYVRDPRGSRPRQWLLAGAWAACALPPFFEGWSAIAGTALVFALGLAALRPIGDT